jgi:hypothetical protein
VSLAGRVGSWAPVGLAGAVSIPVARSLAASTEVVAGVEAADQAVAAQVVPVVAGGGPVGATDPAVYQAALAPLAAVEAAVEVVGEVLVAVEVAAAYRSPVCLAWAERPAY